MDGRLGFLNEWMDGWMDEKNKEKEGHIYINWHFKRRKRGKKAKKLKNQKKGKEKKQKKKQCRAPFATNRIPAVECVRVLLGW
jgi:hypothetical protein